MMQKNTSETMRAQVQATMIKNGVLPPPPPPRVATDRLPICQLKQHEVKDRL